MDRLLVFALVAALTLPMGARAADFTVDTAADTLDANPGDGICADSDGDCSLRAAIQETNALSGADTIALPAGVYEITIAGNDDASASGDFDIGDDLTILGAGANETIIDGGALDRVFDAHAGSVHFQALTVRNGALIGQALEPAGAGLRAAAGVSVFLDDVVLRDNHLTSKTGGIAIHAQGCVTGNRLRILDNRDTEATGSAQATAAVQLDGASACLDLVDSELSGNLADYAGAIESDFAPITIRRSLISDNEARFSGAMLLNRQADTLLQNVTISGNRGNPGAIMNDGGSHLTLVHCTVTANGPSNSGTNVGGIQDVHGGFGLTFLSNTILSGNGPGFIADDCSNATSTGGGNIIGDSARCHLQSQPTDQLDVDPELGPLADNGGFTRTHLPGAAAIDSAQAPACTPTDQRGVPRPLDGDGNGVAACDVGAVEVQRDILFSDGFDPA